MRNIPVDTNAMALTFISVTPKKEGVGANAVQKINADGEKVWTIQVVSKSSIGDEEDTKSEITDLTVSGEKPVMDEFTPIECENLMARFWQMGDRAGVSFSATSIRPKASRSNNAAKPAPSVPAS
jgi:hypothetical protein